MPRWVLTVDCRICVCKVFWCKSVCYHEFSKKIVMFNHQILCLRTKFRASQTICWRVIAKKMYFPACHMSPISDCIILCYGGINSVIVPVCYNITIGLCFTEMKPYSNLYDGGHLSFWNFKVWNLPHLTVISLGFWIIIQKFAKNRTIHCQVMAKMMFSNEATFWDLEFKNLNFAQIIFYHSCYLIHWIKFHWNICQQNNFHISGHLQPWIWTS